MITIEVNGRTVEAQDGETLLARAAARRHPRPHAVPLSRACRPSGACRMCVVEVEGQRGLVPSCAFPVGDGHEGADALAARRRRAARRIVELLLANHPDDCLYCVAQRQLPAAGARRGARRAPAALLRRPRAPAQHRRLEPVDRPRPGQVHPVRQVRARVRGGPGASAPSTSSAAAARRTSAPAFDEGLNVSQLRQLRPVRRGLPDRRAARAEPHQGGARRPCAIPTSIVVVQHAPAVSVTPGRGVRPQAGHRRRRAAWPPPCAGSASTASSTRRFTADLTIMEEALGAGAPPHRPAARCR